MPSKKTVRGRQGEAAGFSILPAALLFEPPSSGLCILMSIKDSN
jgi:hypothetical protein